MTKLYIYMDCKRLSFSGILSLNFRIMNVSYCSLTSTSKLKSLLLPPPHASSPTSSSRFLLTLPPPVQIFDHYRWSPDTDYLFLRNNMPDFSKLQSRLLSRRSSRAYACQCQWTNAQEMEPLTGDLKRLWHCAGRHS